MPEKRALVTGACGITGRAIVELLDSQEDWTEIVAVSRRPLDYKTTKVKSILVDLLDPKDVESKLSPLNNITHIFFAAYKEAVKLKDFIKPNLGMLKNVVDTVDANSQKLKHVALMEGSKWYGFHLGPIPKTPAKEDDPRVMPPNFYYDQEDYLRNKQATSKRWNWSAVRPNPIIGYSTGTPMSLLMAIAAYGTICKELNLPFRFPGSKSAYHIVSDCCDAEIVAKTIVWTSINPACGNQAFNISNGDVFRWCTVWPKIAAFFQLEVPDPPFQQIDLVEMMSDKSEIWDRIIKRHKLVNISFEQFVSWNFAQNFVFNQEFDNFLDVNKVRRYGFTEMHQDTGDMFIKKLTKFREQKLIP